MVHVPGSPRACAASLQSRGRWPAAFLGDGACTLCSAGMESAHHTGIRTLGASPTPAEKKKKETKQGIIFLPQDVHNQPQDLPTRPGPRGSQERGREGSRSGKPRSVLLLCRTHKGWGLDHRRDSQAATILPSHPPSPAPGVRAREVRGALWGR